MKSKPKKNQLVFCLNPKIYSLEAIYSTAYVFVDQAEVSLSGNLKKEIKVLLTGKQKMSQKQLKKLKGEFENELLNYLLRTKIAQHTKRVRDFIVGRALISGLPIPLIEEPRRKTGDWREDPLKIALPWEERFKVSPKRDKGKKSKRKTKK